MDQDLLAKKIHEIVDGVLTLAPEELFKRPDMVMDLVAAAIMRINTHSYIDFINHHGENNDD